MTVSIVGTSTRQAGTAVATLTFATPTGLVNGDFLVVGILAKTISTNWAPPTADAANWVTLYDSQATSPAVRVYGRKWHTGDPTSYAFTGTSGSAIGYIIGLHSTLGVDAISLDPTANSTRATSLTLAYPAETAALTTDISILFAASASTESTFSTPTSYTTQVGFLSQGTSGTVMAAACFTRILTASGSVAPASSTLGTSAANVGAHVLLKEMAPVSASGNVTPDVFTVVGTGTNAGETGVGAMTPAVFTTTATGTNAGETGVGAVTPDPFAVTATATTAITGVANVTPAPFVVTATATNGGENGVANVTPAPFSVTATGTNAGATGNATITTGTRTVTATGTNAGETGNATVTPAPFTVTATGTNAGRTGVANVTPAPFSVSGTGTNAGATGVANVTPAPFTTTATGTNPGETGNANVTPAPFTVSATGSVSSSNVAFVTPGPFTVVATGTNPGATGNGAMTPAPFGVTATGSNAGASGSGAVQVGAALVVATGTNAGASGSAAITNAPFVVTGTGTNAGATGQGTVSAGAITVSGTGTNSGAFGVGDVTPGPFTVIGTATLTVAHAPPMRASAALFPHARSTDLIAPHARTTGLIVARAIATTLHAPHARASMEELTMSFLTGTPVTLIGRLDVEDPNHLTDPPTLIPTDAATVAVNLRDPTGFDELITDGIDAFAVGRYRLVVTAGAIPHLWHVTWIFTTTDGFTVYTESFFQVALPALIA